LELGVEAEVEVEGGEEAAKKNLPIGSTIKVEIGVGKMKVEIRERIERDHN